MSYPGLRVDTEKLGWDPAEVTVPGVPKVEAGPDPISVLVAAVMPNIAGDVTTHVADTRAREERFAGNLQAAQNAYRGADGSGQDQINGAAGNLPDPADAFGAGSPARAPAAAPGGDSGASQLSQMMGMAMQVGQQAVQVPMQAVGMAGQMVQPVVQGVQGIVQQATQASEKPGEASNGEHTTDGFQSGGAGALRESSAEKPEDKDKKDDQKSRDNKTSDKDKPDDTETGAGAGHGPQAPVGAPEVEQPDPGQGPRHQRMTETSPEVAL